jgi:hypothetical protein
MGTSVRPSSKAISQSYCQGQCGNSYSGTEMTLIGDAVCDAGDCSGVHKNFESSWVAEGHLYKKRAPHYIKTGDNTTLPAAFHYNCPLDAGCDANTTTRFFELDPGENTADTTQVSMIANTVYEICGKFTETDGVSMTEGVALGLCDKRLLQSGLLYDWDLTDEAAGRGLHSSTFWLNVSTFCGIRWVHDLPPVY